jgi:hypothetical protein
MLFLSIIELYGAAKVLNPMKIKQVRAVVRRGDFPPAKTDWFPFNSTEVTSAVAKLMPIDEAGVALVWEEREVEVNDPQGPAPQGSQ